MHQLASSQDPAQKITGILQLTLFSMMHKQLQIVLTFLLTRVKGTDVIIKKGHEVQIPILGIHRDPQYYPYPLTFNPENFSKENK